jgi:hypothetical protein
MLQGAAILWKSNKQSMVTLSSTEAEYVGSSDAAREGIWLRRLLNNFIDPCSRNTVAEVLEICGNISATRSATALYMDNQSAMKIVMSSTSQVHEWTNILISATTSFGIHTRKDAYDQISPNQRNDGRHLDESSTERCSPTSCERNGITERIGQKFEWEHSIRLGGSKLNFH